MPPGITPAPTMRVVAAERHGFDSSCLSAHTAHVGLAEPYGKPRLRSGDDVVVTVCPENIQQLVSLVESYRIETAGTSRSVLGKLHALYHAVFRYHCQVFIGLRAAHGNDGRYLLITAKLQYI